MENQNLNMNIDISATQPIVSSAGNQVFAEGVLLRKVSKFVAGTAEDAVVPIPCFYDVKTGEVVKELLPKQVRELFENIDVLHNYEK